MSDVSLLRVSKEFARSGTVVDDITLEIQEGEFFTLLGPSGCGKSTTLRMIAGFEEPTRGTIKFGERDVTALPPNRRNVGIVFQNYALFPHMSVRKNVEFGLRARRTDKSSRRSRVSTALAQVQLDGLSDARVDQLSGGQQQRVALARAIVIEPELLLLDEPLSNLDAKLRDETRASLRRLHDQTNQTLVYVTHDQGEALAMSTRIAVMSRATVHQIGTPREVYRHPASRFVAGFLGHNNILDGFVESVEGEICQLRLASGHTVRSQVHPHSPNLDLRTHQRAAVSVRSEDVRLAAPRSEGENILPGIVTDVEYVGPLAEVTLSTESGDIRCEVPVHVGLPVRGQRLSVELPISATYLLESNVEAPNETPSPERDEDGMQDRGGNL